MFLCTKKMVKGKVFPVHANKSNRGRGEIPFILTLRTTGI